MYYNHTNEGKKRLADFAQLLSDFVKIASKMLFTELGKKRIPKNKLVAFFLFRHAIEASEAISELTKSGCINSCKPLLRTLMESYLQLKFLLQEQEERKSLQFLYHYFYSKKIDFKKLVETQEDNSYFKKLKHDKYLKNISISKKDRDNYKQNIALLEGTLNEDSYAVIEDEYKSVQFKKRNRKGKLGKIDYWFELFNGPTGIEELAKKVEESGLYEIYYRQCSSYLHGLDIVHNNLVFEDDENCRITFFRDIRKLDDIVGFAIVIFERSCLDFIVNKVNEKDEYANEFYLLSKRKEVLLNH